MQVIQDRPRTQRQNAFVNAAGAIAEGINNYQTGQKSQRAEALAIQEHTQKMRDAGYDVNEQQVAASLKPDQSGISKFLASTPIGKAMGFEAQGQRPDLYQNRTKEYIAKQDASADEKDLNAQFKRSQIAKNNKYRPKGSPAIPGEESMPSVANLKGEEKNKVGGIASALQAIDGIENAISDGHNPEYVDSRTPFIGGYISDNPFTENRRTLSEVIGRLQSGGAMGTEEVKNFNDMGPRAGDDKDTVQRKIVLQRNFLHNKLAAYGIQPEHLGKMGFNTEPSYTAKNKKLSSSNTVTAAAPHKDDNAAIEWANKNPNNPKAKEILEANGAR